MHAGLGPRTLRVTASLTPSIGDTRYCFLEQEGSLIHGGKPLPTISCVDSNGDKEESRYLRRSIIGARGEI